MARVPPSDEYQYSPLTDASSQTRLVNLSATLAKTTHGTFPQCKLIHAALHSNAEYTALSYTWGDTTDSTYILIDGKYHSVTTNLADFLQQAIGFLQDESTDSRTFWIDAISINQSDNVEKSKQVRNMGKIFNQASTVFIWLGLAEPDTHLAFKFLKDLSMDYDDDYDPMTPGDIQIMSPTVQRSLTYIDQHYDDTIRPLQSLVLHSWWRRVWIQQEVSRAPLHRTKLICGSALIPWRDLIHAQLYINMIMDHGTAPPDSSFALSPERIERMGADLAFILQMMVRVCWNSYHQVWPHDPRCRFDLLHRLTVNSIVREDLRIQATLPVDYVYSILGISSDIESGTVTQRIDYAKPVEAVNLELATYMFQTKGSILLNFGGVDPPRPPPSWAPDWSKPMQRLSILWRQDIFGPFSVPELYSAAGNSKLFWHETSDTRLLLKGFEVDSVNSDGIMSELFPLLNPDDPFIDEPIRWMRSYEEFQKRLNIDKSHALARDCWRIPIVDQDIPDVKGSTVRASSAMSDAYEELRKAFRDGEHHERASLAAKYRRAMDLVVWNRMPFLSADGRLGIGPNTMISGDKIFVVAGCQTAFILREAGDGEYLLVGDAYVQGIMDGELVNDDTKFKTITIV